ncbi:EF-hand domain-containing protein [Pacificoceanicola onchidii]|uniref:EF-hand domain-containing protein n=1 Tax=Pacificoceanicola onchidii TaxID=2562685 RepID=UPI001455E48D|nr:EF-hand domain-containing protein [Pacificoceanicola onchidii]
MMTKYATLMTGALVLIMGTAGMASAKGGPDREGRGQMMEQWFSEVDANGDGKVTEDEITAFKLARFQEADTDGDGFLSAEEMAAYGDKMREERKAKRSAARAERMIERIDSDDDGKISAEEAAAMGPGSDKMLARLDADDDGAVSLEELQEMRGKMKRRFGGGDHGGWGKGDRGERGGMRGDRMPWWMQ